MAEQQVPQNFQFALDPSPTVRSFSKFFLLMAVVGEIVTLALFASDRASGEDALTLGIFIIFLVAAMALGMWLMSRGVAELTDTRLEVRRVGGKQVYRWTDITELRLRTLRQLSVTNRIWAALTGLSQDQPLVEIKLKRSVRLGLLPWQPETGTDIIGIPSLVFRAARLYLADPEGFVEAANQFLQRGRA